MAPITNTKRGIEKYVHYKSSLLTYDPIADGYPILDIERSKPRVKPIFEMSFRNLCIKDYDRHDVVHRSIAWYTACIKSIDTLVSANYF